MQSCNHGKRVDFFLSYSRSHSRAGLRRGGGVSWLWLACSTTLYRLRSYPWLFDALGKLGEDEGRLGWMDDGWSMIDD